MKLGVNTLFIAPFEVEQGLRFAQRNGAEAIEIACGGGPSAKYCDLEKLLADEDERKRWLETLAITGCRSAPSPPTERPSPPTRRPPRPTTIASARSAS